MKELKSWESRIYLPVNKQYSRRTKYSSKKGTLQPKNDKKLSPVKNYEHRVCRWKFVEGYVKTKSYPSMSRAARAFAMARGRYNRDCHSVKMSGYGKCQNVNRKMCKIHFYLNNFRHIM